MKKSKVSAYVLKMGIVGILIGSGVFFGIELATSGLQRVQGTNGDTAAVSGPLQPSIQGEDKEQADKGKPNPPRSAGKDVMPAKPETTAASATASALTATVPPSGAGEVTFINRFAIKLGEILNSLARGAIQKAVEAFQAIIF